MTIRSHRSGGALEPHERYVGSPAEALSREATAAQNSLSPTERRTALQSSAAQGRHIYMTRDELDDLYG